MQTETLQVLRGIVRPDYGWRHHPVVKMWRGCEEALGAYGSSICLEWCRRGHADTCDAKIRDELTALGLTVVRDQAALAAARALPDWLGDERLHRSHRSALLRKDPDWYGRHFTDVPPDLPAYYPVPVNSAPEPPSRPRPAHRGRPRSP